MRDSLTKNEPHLISMDNTTPSNQNVTLVPNDNVATPLALPNIFTNAECQLIIEYSEKLTTEDSALRDGNKNTLDTNVRDSTQKHLVLNSDTEWIYNRINNAISEANKLYKYDLAEFGLIQITRYDIGGHYIWHSDLGSGVSLRKLSLSVQLSSPEDYDGGKLEFLQTNSEVKHSRELGTTIIFPPFLVHRVTPVTKGTRWALVAWIKGPPFR